MQLLYTVVLFLAEERSKRFTHCSCYYTPHAPGRPVPFITCSTPHIHGPGGNESTTALIICCQVFIYD